MVYDERHDVLYLECFKNNSEGHGLYKPVSATKLKPGVCGYFDHSGDWQSIVDLTDAVAVKKEGWKPASSILVSPDPGEDIWGAVLSESMVKFGIKVDVNAK
jgi:hypothetical protein